MGDEMTLSQFVDSKWTKLVTRAAMVAVAVTSSYIGIQLATYDQRIASVETVVNDVSRTQGDRAETTDQNFAALKSDVHQVKGGVATLQVEFARAMGILSELQRRDVAVARRAFPAAD